MTSLKPGTPAWVRSHDGVRGVIVEKDQGDVVDVLAGDPPSRVSVFKRQIHRCWRDADAEEKPPPGKCPLGTCF